MVMVALVGYTFPLARHVAANVLVPLVVDNELRDWVKNVPLVFFFDWKIVVADVAVVVVAVAVVAVGSVAVAVDGGRDGNVVVFWFVWVEVMVYHALPFDEWPKEFHSHCLDLLSYCRFYYHCWHFFACVFVFVWKRKKTRI